MVRAAPPGVSTLRGPRALAVLIAVNVGLVLTCIWLARRSAPSTIEEVLGDPALRAAAVAELVSRTPAIYDSHPDPQVGHVLLPHLDVELDWGRVETNRFGMRDHEYAVPKPPGTLRIVLLGDSFVFGVGVSAAERLGARLEALLAQRASGSEVVECLHLGVGSWNVVAEARFLLRRLDALQPDVVVQLTVDNDLDDVAGVRGFGGLATFAPNGRARGDGRVHTQHPAHAGARGANLLSAGLDWESRQRFDRAAGAVRDLRDAVRGRGGRYLLLVHWGLLNPRFAEHFEDVLDDGELAFLASDFHADRTVWFGGFDPHWNATGHERVAEIVYGLARRRGLLPSLELALSPASDDLVRSIVDAGRAEVDQGLLPELSASAGALASAVTFGDGATAMRQVHGGIDAAGLVSPYASLLLRAAGKTRLVVRGRALPDSVLAGARVEVRVDDRPVGELVLEPGAELHLDAPLPADVAPDFVSVRFLADDYVHTGDDLRRTVAFRLERVALTDG